MRPCLVMTTEPSLVPRTHAAAALVTAALFFWLVLQLPERDALGRSLPLSTLLGGAFGVLLQRSRFCFYCIARDFIERRDPRGLLGIIVALAVGLLGTYAIFGAWMPQPSAARLPAEAHIGPVSWVLALGALVFGVGMTVSGSCISAHLYRLGEGSPTAPFALLGAVAGFGLGFLSWNDLYLRAIQEAPVIWLPRLLGYGGSLALQLAILAALAFVLMRYRAPGRGVGCVALRGGLPPSLAHLCRWRADRRLGNDCLSAGRTARRHGRAGLVVTHCGGWLGLVAKAT